MNVEDELLALASLIGTIALRVEQDRVKEAWLARHAPGSNEITDPGVMLSVRLVGLKQALGHVSSAKEMNPHSSLLAKLVEGIEKRLADTEADGMDELKRMNWSPNADAKPMREAWSNVIQLFPDKPTGDEPET